MIVSRLNFNPHIMLSHANTEMHVHEPCFYLMISHCWCVQSIHGSICPISHRSRQANVPERTSSNSHCAENQFPVLSGKSVATSAGAGQTEHSTRIYPRPPKSTPKKKTNQNGQQTNKQVDQPLINCPFQQTLFTQTRNTPPH